MRLLAIDTETTLIPPQGTAKLNLRWECPDLVAVSWAFKDLKDLSVPPGRVKATDTGVIPWDDPNSVRDLLDKDFDYIVMHNSAFDLDVLSNFLPDQKERLQRIVQNHEILDTRVMYWLRDPDPRQKATTLQWLASSLCGIKLQKDDVRTSFSRTQKMTEEQERYAAQDAIATLHVAEKLLDMPYGSVRNTSTPQYHIAARVKCDDVTPDERYSSAASWRAWYLEHVGMAVDQDKVAAYDDKLKREVAQLQAQLVRHGLARLQRKPKTTPIPTHFPGELGRSWRSISNNPPLMGRVWKGERQQVEAKVVVTQSVLRERFLELAIDLEIDPPRSKKTRAVSTSRDDWREHQKDMPPDLLDYMDCQRAVKYRSTYTQPLRVSRAKQVLPSYYIPGAATGRWGCRRPNQTNMVKKMKDLYCARPGKKLVVADYPTLELYTLAHAMHCMGVEGPLMSALRGSVDIHTQTAASLFDKFTDDVTKEERQSAKACNFGLPGGMGWRRFLHTYGDETWDEDKARFLRDKWFREFWDVDQYIQMFKKVDAYRDLKPGNFTSKGWIESLNFDPNDTWPSSFDVIRRLGSRIYTVHLPSGRVIPERTYSMGANAIFQGLGADVITAAFNNCCILGLNTVAVVHDSITVETARPEYDSGRLEVAMQTALKHVCPSVPVPTIDCDVVESWC